MHASSDWLKYFYRQFLFLFYFILLYSYNILLKYFLVFETVAEMYWKARKEEVRESGSNQTGMTSHKIANAV